MKRSQALERRESRASGINIWSVVGVAALVAAAAVVVVSLPDIRRYIKISTM
jgi:hypothetical protein